MMNHSGHPGDTGIGTPIGLLIVHGIGNQKRGSLSATIAAQLSDIGGLSKAKAYVSDTVSDNAAAVEPEVLEPEMHMAQVNSTTIFVREAHWAARSHPDNPPNVRQNTDVQVEFFRTIRASWQSALFLGDSDHQPRPKRRPQSLLVWMFLAVFITACAMLFVDQSIGSPHLSLPTDFFMTLLGMGFAAYGIYSCIDAVRYLRQEKERPDQQGSLVNLSRKIAKVILAFCRPLLLLLGAEVLLFFSLLVLVASVVNPLGALLTYLARGIGVVCGWLRLPFLVRWVHRIGSVMIVMPTHSFLQVVRAFGNLLSVVFVERGFVPRATAFLGLIGVSFASFALLIICELLLIVPLIPFLPDAEAQRGWFSATPFDLVTYFLVILPFYLFIVKIALPAIDLILDIARYHLGSKEDRRKDYFECVGQGVAALSQAGCRDIHVLAHSLGSVIFYDWLHSKPAGPCPVNTLYTVGSPLDKFWYLDHSEERRRSDKMGLTGRISGSWVNYWAYSDPVSGELNHYDAPDLHVINKRLRWSGLYLWSHSRYWRNPKVIAEIHSRIRMCSGEN